MSIYFIYTACLTMCQYILVLSQTEDPEEKVFPLVQNRAFVDDDWVESISKFTFSVFNPCNRSEIASVPDMNVKDVNNAIHLAHDAFLKWRQVAPKQNSYEIARVIALESGKPIAEAITEVSYGNSFVEMYAEETTRIKGESLTSNDNSKQYVFLREPIGVVALVTPWNFPHTLLLRKAAAALAAGCTCVVKPAEDTPLTALAIASTLQQAGFPKGVFNVITSSNTNTPAVVKAMCESPHIAGVSFTGSTEVGQRIYRLCSPGVKRISLELGGNSAFIVFPSADLDNAVDSAFAAKFRNCGQACVSPNRFLVHKNHFDKFVERLTWKMKNNLNFGSNFDPLNNIGPLINENQLKRVTRLVTDAVAKGAKVHIGGEAASNCGPLFFQPTLLTNLKPDMDILHTEIFGPVAVCIPFETEDEALSLAHNTTMGLAGYFFTSDLDQAWRVAKRLEVGMVGVNEGHISTPQVAFGGIKHSGFGREGSHHGIDEFSFVKTVCFGKC